jgi:hypothetical protein
MKRKLINLAALWAAVTVVLAASPNLQAQITLTFELPGNGRTPSTPSAVTVAGDTGIQVEVFIRGNNNRIFVNTFFQNHPGDWTGWREVEGDCLTISEPEAVVHNNVVKLYVRGQDNEILENVHTGPPSTPEAGWSGCHEVQGDGRTLSGPAAVIDGNGRLSLFVRGLNNRIFQNNFRGGSFGGWQEVRPGGTSTISRPEAVFHMGNIKLFVRGIGNGILQNVFTGDTGTMWNPVPGGALTLAGPSALTHMGTLKLFITGLDDTLFENDSIGTSFGPWKRISSTFPGGGSGAQFLTPSAPNALQFFNGSLLFLRSEDGKIFDAGF